MLTSFRKGEAEALRYLDTCPGIQTQDPKLTNDIATTPYLGVSLPFTPHPFLSKTITTTTTLHY